MNEGWIGSASDFCYSSMLSSEGAAFAKKNTFHWHWEKERKKGKENKSKSNKEISPINWILFSFHVFFSSLQQICKRVRCTLHTAIVLSVRAIATDRIFYCLCSLHTHTHTWFNYWFYSCNLSISKEIETRMVIKRLTIFFPFSHSLVEFQVAAWSSVHLTNGFNRRLGRARNVRCGQKWKDVPHEGFIALLLIMPQH